jgi:hypothetical protein
MKLFPKVSWVAIGKKEAKADEMIMDLHLAVFDILPHGESDEEEKKG